MRSLIEAEIDEYGNLRPKEPLALPRGSRVMVLIVEDSDLEPALLCEPSLAVDWQRPEEDAPWVHLGQA